jgi:murein DD-endopeptidase MepM/ murein hydrolase activator NlpD
VDAEPESKFAVDFTMPSGTEIFAMRDGVVVGVEESNPDLPVDATTGATSPAPTDADKDKANVVRVRHADGTFAVYVHLKNNGASVAVGDAVTAGTTKIGDSGNSGFSTGPHLHVAVLKLKFDEAANTSESVSIPFKFKGPTGAGVTPGKGQKFKRTS